MDEIGRPGSAVPIVFLQVGQRLQEVLLAKLLGMLTEIMRGQHGGIARGIRFDHGGGEEEVEVALLLERCPERQVPVRAAVHVVVEKEQILRLHQLAGSIEGPTNPDILRRKRMIQLLLPNPAQAAILPFVDVDDDLVWVVGMSANALYTKLQKGQVVPTGNEDGKNCIGNCLPFVKLDVGKVIGHAAKVANCQQSLGFLAFGPGQPAKYLGTAHIPTSVALGQPESGAAVCANILLDDLDGILLYLADDGHMSKLIAAKNDDVIHSGLLLAAIAPLIQVAIFVVGAIGKVEIEKILGVSPGIGHAMLEVIEVVAFDKLHTLPLQSIIVAICTEVPTTGVVDAVAIVVDGNAVEIVDDFSDGVGLFVLFYQRGLYGHKAHFLGRRCRLWLATAADEWQKGNEKIQ